MRADNATAQCSLFCFKLSLKTDRIAFKLLTEFDNLHAQIEISHGADLSMQTEAVEQLRAQFPFFRIAGADQDKASRVADTDPFALDDIAPACRRVEEQINEMIFQQVDLIDIKKASIGACQ